MFEYEKDGAAIYRQSFATIRAEADLAGLPADVAQVVVRMIHACGMVDLVASGEIDRDSTVLYAHLGGQPALNAYASLFTG